jgi:broad specificity phosphatase PhoE
LQKAFRSRTTSATEEALEEKNSLRGLLILTRHTQTDWNAQDVLSGWSDKPTLTHMGRAEAHGIGESAASALDRCGAHLAGIWASDLQRAQEAAYFAHKGLLKRAPWYHALGIQTDKGLREVNVGTMTGHTKEETLKRFPPETHPKFVRQQPDFDLTEVGGETERGVIKRQRESLARIIHAIATQYGNVPNPAALVVGHGTALRSLLRAHELSWGPLADQGTVLPLWLDATLEWHGNIVQVDTLRLQLMATR